MTWQGWPKAWNKQISRNDGRTNLQPSTPCLSTRCTLCSEIRLFVTALRWTVSRWSWQSEFIEGGEDRKNRVGNTISVIRHCTAYIKCLSRPWRQTVSGGTDPPIVNRCTERRAEVSYTSKRLCFRRNSCWHRLDGRLCGPQNWRGYFGDNRTALMARGNEQRLLGCAAGHYTDWATAAPY